MKAKTIFVAIAALALLCSCGQTTTQQTSSKPRIVVTTDPELDDLNSLIRFLLFSTDYEVEGLVYASSQFHWKGDGQGTKQFIPGREYDKPGLNKGPMESWRWAPGTQHIDDAVNAYEASYENLKVHNPDYPTPEYLRSKIAWGNVEFDGDYSKDTEGSELIKSLILDDGEPVIFQAWGGASTIARALVSIKETYGDSEEWPAIRQKVIDKTTLSLSGDQDNTYEKYIGVEWPEIQRLEINGYSVGLAYMAPMMAKPESKHFYSPEWMEENVIGVGPFGDIYRYWGDGKQFCPGDMTDYFGMSGYTEDELRKMGYWVWCPVFPKGSFLGEGDTYCFLNLIGNGLRGHENPTYGGWCLGKIEVPDSVQIMPAYAGRSQWVTEHYPLPDFTEAIFNGFAARMKWCVTPSYEDANHEPVISGALALSGKPGQTIKLNYNVSDPDGDEVSVNWWDYRAASSYKGAVAVADPTSASTSFTIPADAQSGQTIHLILEATDSGTPRLNHYLRAIVTVK